MTPYFETTVSSEEVARGKPAPDVYVEATRQLGVDPRRAAERWGSRSGSEAPTRPGCA